MVIDKAISIKNTNVAEEKGNEKLKFNDIEEKEKLLENSKKEAEAIIQAAKNESEKILQSARNEASKIQKEQQNYLEKKQKLFEDELKKISSEITRIEKEYEIYINEVVKQSLVFTESIIKITVEKYFKETIEPPKWFETIFKNFEDKLNSLKNAKLRISPTFNKNLREIVINVFKENFMILEDSSLRNGEIFLETDQGIFDLTPETFVNSILEILEVSFDENN